MNLKYSIIVATVFITVLASCKRESVSGNDEVVSGESVSIDAKNLKAPEGFNFSTEKTLNVRVGVLDKKTPDEQFIIKIYNATPTGESLVSTGITNAATGEYITSLRVSAVTDYIWIERISFAGASQTQKVKASLQINHIFTTTDGEGMIVRKAGSGLKCNSNCTNTYNNHSGSITISSGQIACFTGTINSNIVVSSGAAVKICASGTLSGLTINGTGRAYILEGATISASNINTNNASAEFYNWSFSLTSTGSVSFNGFCENHGDFVVNSDFNINSSGQFGNYGELEIKSNLNVSNDFLNYSRITVNGAMNNNSNAEFNNYCYLYVKGNLNNNGILYNGRLVKTGQTYTQNSSGKTNLDDVGLLSVKNLMMNGVIEGTGTSRAVVKVTANTTINASGRLKGIVDLCDSTGIETNNGQVISPAAITCGGYIPTCPCNTEGFGQPHIDDDDGDGIPNNQDEYPNDSLRAFNSYIPCFNVCYTLAYEDLWPGMGDYDYNDKVVKFSIHKVLNASNKVVDLKFKVQPVAIGASFDNGLGFRLDEVLPSAVGSVTGQSLIRNYVTRNSNGTEAGQDRAVIIIYDSPEPFIHRTGGSMFNTLRSNPTGTTDLMTVVVTFSTPVNDALLDIAKLNPFIITNKRRGYEVHLPDYKPTSLANTALFGTMQDRSNPSTGKYYRSENNMPWAFMIQDVFSYPLEKTSITTAYNYFDDWVISGGTQYPNWYRNFPQYRNNELIY